MTPLRRLSALLTPVLLCGCGNPGLPLPPSLMLPQPVVDLEADRTADTVHLHWTMPRRTTDRVLLKTDQRAAICRAVAAGSCEPMGLLKLEAGKSAAFSDQLPASLARGPAMLLRYEVRLENPSGRDAGASNPAFAAAGWAPPAVQSASADVTARGIAVRWQAQPEPAQSPAAGAQLRARLIRDLVLAAGASNKPSNKPGRSETEAGVPQPPVQTLEALEHPPAVDGGPWTPATTLDSNAAMLRSYRYTVALVEQVVLDGHVLEIAGRSASTGVVDANDVFPPAVPDQLAAVADADAGTIDLSWNGATDPDLAGYVVYRRTVGSQAPLQRVSGAALLPTPNWTDTAVQKGERYAYAVSSVDASGNESTRSSEVEEQLP